MLFVERHPMFRRQGTLFLMLILIGLLSFIYSSRALADLTTRYSPSGQTTHAALILNPVIETPLPEAELELKLVAAQSVVQERLAQLGMNPQQVTVQDGQLLVEVSHPENMAYFHQVIAYRGQVEFIDGGLELPPLGQKIQTEDQAGQYPTLFTGQAVTEITPPDVANGEIFYQLTLAPSATAELTTFIEKDQKHYLCMTIDQEVISCSKMYHWAEGQLDILPDLSSGSMLNLSDLALFLQSGPLPMALKVQPR